MTEHGDNAAALSDRPGFEEVYRQHSVALYRYCLSLLADPALAEDIAAEAMLDAYRAYHRAPQDPDGIRPWLFRIAKNAAVDHWRSSKRWRLVAARLFSQAREDVASVEGTAEINSELRDVLDDLGGLSKRDRELIALRIAGGLSFAQIGATMGMTEAYAGIAYSRALQRVHTAASRRQG